MSGGNERWLIVPVEVQVRELLSRLLVATVAASRGWQVLIGHDRVIRRLAWHLPRGVLFDKALGATGDRKVKRYARLGYTLTAVDEESTGFHAHPKLYLSARLSEETISLAERWFCVSDIFREIGQSEYPAHAHKFVTTGLPRTDIWRPAFHALHEEESRRVRERHGRFILFCSNFGGIIHARERAFVDRQLRRADQTHEDARSYREQVAYEASMNLEGFLAMLPKLRSWFPDRKLLVRPHPSEDREFWKARFAGVDGVEVEGGGIATPVILASECLVHHGCTTGIEAALLGKPSVMFAPHPDRHHETDAAKAFSPMVRTEDELKALIGQCLEGRGPAGDRVRQAHFYHGIDGELVASRIVAEMEKLPSASGGRLPAYLPLLRFGPRQLAADYWPRPARARAYARQKWQGVTLETMRGHAERLAAIAAPGFSPLLEEVYPQLYRISGQP